MVTWWWAQEHLGPSTVTPFVVGARRPLLLLLWCPFGVSALTLAGSSSNHGTLESRTLNMLDDMLQRAPPRSMPSRHRRAASSALDLRSPNTRRRSAQPRPRQLPRIVYSASSHSSCSTKCRSMLHLELCSPDCVVVTPVRSRCSFSVQFCISVGSLLLIVYDYIFIEE